MADTSPFATADSTALDASITALSTGVSAAWACSRTVDLRAKASSIGWRKASQSFCSKRRSNTTAWASSCQRSCKALTASMRNVGAAPSACASAIKALRRSKLAFCTASRGSCAAWIAPFHWGCNSANIFSLKWPLSRQRWANWCNWRATPFQSGPWACSAAQVLSSSIKAKRWALLAAVWARASLSQASTTTWALLQAASNRFHKAGLGAACLSTFFHSSRK